MTIERDSCGRFIKGGKKNPKSYIWTKDNYCSRKGLSKQNSESVRRQSEKVSKTIKAMYAEGKKIPISENPKTRGKLHWNWKGGATSKNEKLRRTRQYKLWRIAVFERDNYTCIWCGVRGGRLNADHIKPFSQYPELRFAIDNGRTLCLSCHRKTKTYGGNSRCIKKN